MVGRRNAHSSSNKCFQTHFIIGFVIRFLMIIYGDHYDRKNILKYTDVDYHVVTDAAREVLNHGSPYNCHTYRYTPFLAWLLIPNITFHFVYGKLLFSVLDCLVSKLIYTILMYDGHNSEVALKCSFLWLYNPIVIAISSRGSSETVVAILVLTMVFMLKLKLPLLTGFMLGVATHVKLYPIIYSLPVYLCFTQNSRCIPFLKKLLPNKAKIYLLLGAAFSFIALTGIGVLMYGETYIEEAFLFHFTRIDTRHNFSVFFYLLYISADYNIPGLSLATFVPQVILLFAISAKFGNYSDVIFCLFAQTAIFVTFNKVVTSQYFVWYLLLLPLLMPHFKMTKTKAFFLGILWIAAQASWLLPAYLLEFSGINTFLPLWLESVAFFCCNSGILIALISSYSAVQSGTAHKLQCENVYNQLKRD